MNYELSFYNCEISIVVNFNVMTLTFVTRLMKYKSEL